MIYTTEYDDCYVLETIVADDIISLRQAVSGQQERVMEAEFNYDVEDATSTILETERIVKIRKLNKKIGDNLKLLYGYRCQISRKFTLYEKAEEKEKSLQDSIRKSWYW